MDNKPIATMKRSESGEMYRIVERYNATETVFSSLQFPRAAAYSPHIRPIVIIISLEVAED